MSKHTKDNRLVFENKYVSCKCTFINYVYTTEKTIFL